MGLDAARTLAERDVICLTLTRVGRNITHAARELGVSRMTLYRLMDKHGIALESDSRPHGPPTWPVTLQPIREKPAGLESEALLKVAQPVFHADWSRAGKPAGRA
jgi:transposase-like protein